jgi:PAS domain S-box-containing protein
MNVSVFTGEVKETKTEQIQINYEQFIQALPVAIYTCDKDGHITMFNKAAAELWGREPEIGKDIWCGSWKIFEPDGITPMSFENCPMALTLKKGHAVTGREIIVERPDGQRRWVQPYPEPILDAEGNLIGAVNMLIDISERKQTDNNSAKLAAIVQSSDDAIISKTLDGIITSWNPAAVKMFGYTEFEMIGQHITTIIPTDRLSEEAHIIDRIKKGKRVDHFETQRQTKDGKLIDISLTISPIKDEHGHIVGASKIARDITLQKMLHDALTESEERYKQLAEKLEFRVQEKTKDLKEINAKLQTSNNELEQFAFVTSHDLQEPLRKVQTFANMLKDKNEDILDEKSKFYIDKILNASQRMSSLISDLLDFSRLRKYERFVQTDLNKIINGVLSDLEIVVAQKNAQISVEKLPVIDAVPLQMNQLFHNLISNALKFSTKKDKPEIKLSARKLSQEEAAVHGVETAKDNAYYEIIVSDNGIGFDQKYANKIFEIFQQLNERDVFAGTGIGLALCNKIVLNHNGKIFANSEEGKGAQFHIILPLKQVERTERIDISIL